MRNIDRRRCIVLYTRGMLNKHEGKPYRLLVYPNSPNDMGLKSEAIQCYWMDVPGVSESYTSYKSINMAGEALRHHIDGIAKYTSVNPHPDMPRSKDRVCVDGRNVVAFVDKSGNMKSIRGYTDFSRLLQDLPNRKLVSTIGAERHPFMLKSRLLAAPMRRTCRDDDDAPVEDDAPMKSPSAKKNKSKKKKDKLFQQRMRDAAERAEADDPDWTVEREAELEEQSLVVEIDSEDNDDEGAADFML